VGAVAFWLANLVISITPVAATYRSTLGIDYGPMLAQAAAGGLVLAAAVASLLSRVPDRLPGGGPVRQALLLALVALVLLTGFLEAPAKARTGVADPTHLLFVATIFNTIRILALGLGIGLVTRAQRTRRNRHRPGELGGTS
jgi:hypothetical protein